MDTEDVGPSSGLRKGLLLLVVVFQLFFTVMGTFLELFLFSQLLSSLYSLSTDILFASASLLVGADLGGVISSVNVNFIISQII